MWFLLQHSQLFHRSQKQEPPTQESATKYIYSSTVVQYKFEYFLLFILISYLNIYDELIK